MDRARAGRRATLGLVGAAIAASACTLVGLGVGAFVDHKRTKLEPAPAWRVLKLHPGTRVALHLSDGQRIEGELARTEFREPGSYRAAYEGARVARTGRAELPELGPCVLKETADPRDRDVHWVGVDLTGIVVGKEARTIVPFERIGALRDAAGRVVSGPVLQELVEARQMPLLSMVALKGVSQPVLVENVVQVEVPSKPNGKLIGTIVGLLADAAIIAAVATDDSDSPPSCSPSPVPGCTSCPFALSFDGTRYVRDAEVLGLATLQAAQQTDRAMLAHIAEVDGGYRLRLANELREVDAIDAVRLLVADAPTGAWVVPAPDGRLLALTSPLSPRRVRDLRGRDVTPLLERVDGVSWLSSPWGRDPERDEDLRDGLVMEFDRPSGAGSVTLAFRLRSTTWAVQLLTEALALHGRDLTAWRARMNGDAVARSAFFAALRREVLPAISVWDGDEWRPAGVLSNLGPWLDREQALRISLQGTSGPTLRVRLDSSPGLWIVDSVMADFGTPPAIDVVVLTPRRADLRGQDVRGPLSEKDGRRVMLEQGDSIEMVFGAPHANADRSRSAFVEATGYYTPLVPADGAPRPELFEGLLAEPGAIARWSLRMFAEETALARSDAMRPTSGARQGR